MFPTDFGPYWYDIITQLPQWCNFAAPLETDLVTLRPFEYNDLTVMFKKSEMTEHVILLEAAKRRVHHGGA